MVIGAGEAAVCLRIAGEEEGEEKEQHFQQDARGFHVGHFPNFVWKYKFIFAIITTAIWYSS